MKKINEMNWTANTDIDPEGYWDVEAQEFVPDERKLARRILLGNVEEMEFPTIINAVADYEISWGVETDFYSLGLIESVEEGRAAVEKFIASFSGKGPFPYITICSASIKGVSLCGGAYYEEAEEVD